jgi:cytochrome c-type biogenesis protein CcmH
VRGLRIAPLLAIALLLSAAASNDPADRLSNPAQEARARTLFREVRCLVCQNESIDDSEADLAGDLRRVVRTQVASGKSDAEIKRYLVDRYGEFVLLKPSFSLANAVLWLTPFALVFGGGAILLLRVRRPQLTAETSLSNEEEAALTAREITET